MDMTPTGNVAMELGSLSSIVECDVCFEVMTEPKALKCLHHFCKTCIHKLCKNTQGHQLGVVLCPLCRKETFQNEIQESFMMNRLLEMYRNQINPRSKDKRCLQCDQPNVTCICTDCHIELCKECKERHLRIPSLRNHHVVDLSEKREVVNNVMYCQEHPACKIKYNCIPCEMAVCAECKIEKHDQHETESVEEALKRVTCKAKEHLKSIESHKEQVKNKLISIENFQKYKSNYDETNERVISQTKQIIQTIQSDSEKLLNDLQDHHEAQSKKVKIMKDDLENRLNSLESLHSWSHAILDITGGPGALCELQQGLYQRIEACATEQPPEKFNLEPYTFISNFEFVSMKKNTVGKLNIDSQSTGSKQIPMFCNEENKESSVFPGRESNEIPVFSSEKYKEIPGFPSMDNSLFQKRTEITPVVPEIRSSINIFVETLTGKTVCFQMSTNSTVLALKHRIQNKLLIPWNKQRLAFKFLKKELLQDHRTLAECDIPNDTILTV